MEIATCQEMFQTNNLLYCLYHSLSVYTIGSIGTHNLIFLYISQVSVYLIPTLPTFVRRTVQQKTSVMPLQEKRSKVTKFDKD